MRVDVVQLFCWDAVTAILSGGHVGRRGVDESRWVVADCRGSSDSPVSRFALQNSATTGDVRFMKKKQRATCVNGEKWAVHFGAVARLLQGMWLFHALSPCHCWLSFFACRANHRLRARRFRADWPWFR
jgi:hypothetical protein